jgi:predicted amino acid dehydrogenase
MLEISWFKPGAIVCDVGYPKSVSYLSEPRDDIFLFDGGLTKSPTPLNLPINVGLSSPDIMYGCFAESIILDLEKRYENFSSGRGNITPGKIEEIRSLGKKHGFEVSDFYWNGKVIAQTKIEKIKAIV